jgi:hypothetical protein
MRSGLLSVRIVSVLCVEVNVPQRGYPKDMGTAINQGDRDLLGVNLCVRLGQCPETAIACYLRCVSSASTVPLLCTPGMDSHELVASARILRLDTPER